MERGNQQNNSKAPVDELFARKLGNVSLPPSSDGFERLQARMNRHHAEPRMVIWRNPNVQRVMAIAASLVLVCLFGWLYLSDKQQKDMDGAQVADDRTMTHGSRSNEPFASSQKQGTSIAQTGQKSNYSLERQTSALQKETQIAKVEKRADRLGNVTAQTSAQSGTLVNRSQPVQTVEDVDVLVAQARPADSKIYNEAAQKASANETPVTPERVANGQPPVTPTAERVLVVTIAEPERLVAARSVAKTAVSEPALAEADKAQKEVKQGGFWEQVRRVKQGEVFARRNAGDEERGLISRAYNGLKHSIDKDKDTK